MRYSTVITSIFLASTTVVFASPIALVEERNVDPYKKLQLSDTQLVPRGGVGFGGHTYAPEEGQKLHVLDKSEQISQDEARNQGYGKEHGKYADAKRATAAAQKADNSAQLKTQGLKITLDRKKAQFKLDPTDSELEKQLPKIQKEYDDALDTSLRTESELYRAKWKENLSMVALELATKKAAEQNPFSDSAELMENPFRDSVENPFRDSAELKSTSSSP